MAELCALDGVVAWVLWAAASMPPAPAVWRVRTRALPGLRAWLDGRG